MRVARDYGEIPSYQYYPEQEQCPHCGGELERSHPVWSKTVVSLNETAKVTNWGYRCCNRQTNCPKPDIVYRSAMADGLTLSGYSFGLDVIVFVGQQRFKEYRSLGEIHRGLEEQEIIISERRVTDYMSVYETLLKCTQKDKIAERREEIMKNGGVLLAIDGVQPEKGKETLYLFRDTLTGLHFHAVSLLHNDTASLVTEMQVVDVLLKELKLPLLSIISDNQDAIVAGAAQVWPETRHQLCQLHFLKAIQKPIYQADSSLAKELKKGGAESAASNGR